MVSFGPTFKRVRSLVLPLSAVVLAVTLGLLSQPGTPTSAATKYAVFAGGGRAGISVDMFRPSTIFVAQGDTIEWTNPYEEIHTVTFVPNSEKKTGFQIAEDVPFIIPLGPAPLPGVAPPPGPPKLGINPKVATPAPLTGIASVDGATFLNSGVLSKGGTFTATFPKQGEYRFLCIVHPFMEVKVQVLAPNTTVPTQAMIDAEAAGQLAAQLAKGEASAAAARPGPREVVIAPSVEFASVNRFIPQRIQVNAGDTVTWKNPTEVPHTVTFNLPPTPPGAPPFLIPEPQASGPPLLVLAPNVLFPQGPRSFDGAGYVNSGFIGTGAEATGGQSFSLTFTKAGTYSYICVLHIDQGMAGVVEVGSGGGATGGGGGGTPIRPPSTGNGGLIGATGDGSSWYFYAVGTIMLAVGMIVAMRVRIHA
jgi:plastocyanin